MKKFNHHKLLEVRLELELTQEQAASTLGIDVRTYRRYESGEVNDPHTGFAVRRKSRQRVLHKICEQFGLEESDLLTAPEPPKPKREKMPCYAHPLQRAKHFVGREAEFSALRSAMEAPGVVALVAVGGAGKTAVLHEFLRQRGSDSLFVWSFYEDPRIEAFLERAERYFCGTTEGPGLRLERLCAALGDGAAHWMALDGLEVVQSGGDGRALGELIEPVLRRLLTTIAMGCAEARAIITSRFHLADLTSFAGDGFQTISLSPLQPEESVELLRRWGLVGESSLLVLTEHVGGHALSVAMLGSYIGGFLGGDPSRLDAVVLDEARRDDALARRLSAVLNAYADALLGVERDLLARLSVFANGVELGVLVNLASAGGDIAGEIAGLDRSAILRLLSRLEKLGLVFFEGDRCSAHPFVREHFKTLVVASSIHEVIKDDLQSKLTERPRVAPKEPALLDAYERLLVHTLSAERPLEAYEIYIRSMGGFEHLGLVLGDMHRGARVTGLFEGAQLSDSILAELCYEQGLYAGALGDLQHARRCYQRHLELIQEEKNSITAARGLRTLAYTERLAGALPRALELIQDSIAESARVQSFHHLVRGISLLGAIHHDLGNSKQASEAFSRVRALGDQPVARRALWEAEHKLAIGEIGEIGEDGEDVEEEMKANLEHCRALGWEGHEAHCALLLARCALEKSPPDHLSARIYLQSAKRWTSVTGEVEMVLRLMKLEAQLALAEGRLNEANTLAKKGRQLTAMMGYGVFHNRFLCLELKVALAQKDLSFCTAQLQGVLEHIERHPDPWGHRWALKIATQIHEAKGDNAQAALTKEKLIILQNKLGVSPSS